MFIFNFFFLIFWIWQILYQELHQHMQVTDQVIMFAFWIKYGTKQMDGEKCASLCTSTLAASFHRNLNLKNKTEKSRL